MIDNMLLVSMRLQGTYYRLIDKIPEDLISGDTVGMLKWYGAFFKAFPDKDNVEYETFSEFIRLRLNKMPDKMELMLNLWKEINVKPTYYLSPGHLESLIEDVWLAGKAGMIAAQYQAGEEIDIKTELTNAINEHNSGGLEEEFDSTPISDILNEFSEEGGFTFSFCGMLRDSLYPITPGNLIMVAARVNQGKTSLLCRILADWSQQVEKVYGYKRPIMYLNNESAVSRIKGRLYQAALQATIPELQGIGDEGELDHKFKLATNGCDFLFKDIHGWDVSKVESLVKQYEPGILLIDMPANIKLSGKFHNTVDAVEHIWQSMREWSVLYNTVVIGTAQISIEGDDMLFPPLSSVKDSKGAVQGALDLQINMGYVSSMPGLRGLGVVKSKRIRPGVSVMQAEVWFNNDNCTFNDGE